MGIQPAKLRQSLLAWYKSNRRDLPWRQDRNPYRIWLSEVMLQQTTTQAVIPFYEKFLGRFPTLKELAMAPENEVIKYWAGLGYYSRARNLHKASQILHGEGFPKTAAELLELPGFGPYTSRAVASLAFDEPVGVLDGNVIRILSRVYGEKWKWWTTKDRQTLQNKADELASQKNSAETNQAMMELGATICTPQSPACFLCPWQKNCVARIEGRIEMLPLKKPKSEGRILLWSPKIYVRGSRIAFVDNTYAPFLKGSKILPGRIADLTKRPVSFDYKHTITNYEIYARLTTKKASKSEKPPKDGKYYWLDIDKIPEEVPYSLITKALKHLKLLT